MPFEAQGKPTRSPFEAQGKQEANAKKRRRHASLGMTVWVVGRGWIFVAEAATHKAKAGKSRFIAQTAMAQSSSHKSRWRSSLALLGMTGFGWADRRFCEAD
jgi:hypothetical protein